VGVPLRSVGIVPVPEYGTVVKHDPLANVLSGCEVVIEGCMDETALNWDRHANVNTGTWCIPIVRGCMMPDRFSGSRYPGSTGLYFDGALDMSGAANYEPSATKNSRTWCLPERFGCTAPTALNFDEHATISTECYFAMPGCLDPRALNFGCELPGADACSTPPEVSTDVNTHVAPLCTYSLSELTPLDSTEAGSYYVQARYVFNGTVEEFGEDTRVKMVLAFAAALNVPSYDVSLELQPGSVIAVFNVWVSSVASKASMIDQIGEVAQSKEQMNLLFATTGAPTVISNAVVTITYLAPPPHDYTPVIAGVVVAILGVCACICVFYFWLVVKPRRSKMYSPTVVPT